eukprot:TRINITY_DN66132_c2_g1_i1.p2 TRINITY_DN66132_c2_g1~~TRINITY_DN66132_c2_g1_i1.p2  ORF type:complete len:375 (+),score=170.14 TRINITY_DN66132_c2_g1_i1:412-1536(+)
MTITVFLEAHRTRTKRPEDLKLYVFDDQDSSWPAVYGRKDLSCAQKIARARNVTTVSWDKGGRWKMRARIHEHVRPRFWYLVAANCNGFEQLFYEVSFINQGSAWDKEFGVNERGLNTLFVLFFLIYMALTLVHSYGIHKLWPSEVLHPIVKLLTAAITLQFFAVFFYLVHYGSFVGNGYGMPPLHAAAEVLQVMARLVFTLQLILIAQGWTISTDELRNRASLHTLFGLTVLAYGALVLWNMTTRDPASTLYVYESWPGVLLIALDIVMGLWFVKAIVSSHNDEDDESKRYFYRLIGFCYVLFFFTLPAVVLAAHNLQPWVREKTVTTISLLVVTLDYVLMAVLLWPTRAHKYFSINTPDVMYSSLNADEDDL